MARTVADTALMLSVIAGADPRSPISYAVNPRAFLDAVRRPSVRGLRVAWAATSASRRSTTRSARSRAPPPGVSPLGARVEEVHPDFSGLREIVLTSRGISMVARHEEKLAKWRGVMQENLVKNIDHGLALTPVEIGRAERLRTELWHRVRAFRSATT